MSDVGNLLHTIRSVTDHPDIDRAATRAVLHRTDTDRLTAEETVTVLQALGLVASESGGRYRPNGIRDTKKPRGSRQSPVDDQTHPDLPGADEDRSTAAAAGRNQQLRIDGGAA